MDAEISRSRSAYRAGVSGWRKGDEVGSFRRVGQPCSEGQLQHRGLPPDDLIDAIWTRATRSRWRTGCPSGSASSCRPRAPCPLRSVTTSEYPRARTVARRSAGAISTCPSPSRPPRPWRDRGGDQGGHRAGRRPASRPPPESTATSASTGRGGREPRPSPACGAGVAAARAAAAAPATGCRAPARPPLGARRPAAAGCRGPPHPRGALVAGHQCASNARRSASKGAQHVRRVVVAERITVVIAHLPSRP